MISYHPSSIWLLILLCYVKQMIHYSSYTAQCGFSRHLSHLADNQMNENVILWFCVKVGLRDAPRVSTDNLELPHFGQAPKLEQRDYKEVKDTDEVLRLASNELARGHQ